MNSTLLDDFHKTGYDREEEYFFRINRELIREAKEQIAPPPLKASRDGITSVPSRVLWRWVDALTKPLPSGIGQVPV